VKPYWVQLGEKLGRYAEPLAIVLLDLMAESTNGSQRLVLHWTRNACSRVRLENETEIRPAEADATGLTG
jgi:hypothetical protein